MNSTENFLRDVNKAFSEGDSQFLMSHVTDDFCWVVVGEKTVGGKSEFSEALEEMRNMPPMNIEIENILLSRDSAVVEGTVIGRNKNGQKKYFGFCDIYELTGDKDIKIKKMTSYVIDISKYKQYRETC